MTSRLATTDGLSAVQAEAYKLLDTLKTINNSDLVAGGRVFSNPAALEVSIEMAKGNITTLSRLCKKVDVEIRRAMEGLVEEAQQKIQFTEKVMEFLLSQIDNTPDKNKYRLDPRIEKILAKLTPMQEDSLPQDADQYSFVFKKLGRFSEKAGKVYCDHPPTAKACDEAISIIGKLELQLLQAAPQVNGFKLNLLSCLHDHHYQDLPDVDKCKKMAGSFYSVIYLNMSMLEPFPDGRFNEAAFGTASETHVHFWTANYIKENPSKNTLSLSDALGDYYGQFLIGVPLTEGQTPLSYPPSADKKEIRRQLDTLIELKNNDVKLPLGAFIEIGSQTLAIVFHVSGRISLFNPYGRQGLLRNYLYESHFGNSGQVAESLKELTAEISPDTPITLRPYRRLEGKVHAESSESSGEEDNTDIDENDDNDDVITSINFEKLGL